MVKAAVAVILSRQAIPMQLLIYQDQLEVGLLFLKLKKNMISTPKRVAAHHMLIMHILYLYRLMVDRELVV